MPDDKLNTTPSATIAERTEHLSSVRPVEARHFPLPWRVEEDWTAEIIAANGKLVMKLPYPINLSEAHAIVRAVNEGAK
jgi:hypothetical protein